MPTKEQTILTYMEKLGLTREEAEQLWNDDNSDTMTEEQKELTEKAKKAGRHYEQSDKPRKKTKKERKINETKGYILTELTDTLKKLECNITGSKTETEVYFEFEDKKYTLKLTEHRK